MKFRKKPVVIDAVQFFANKAETHAHVNYSEPVAENCEPSHVYEQFWIKTLDGPMIVSEGDWIITGIKGERYPCKPDIFEATYEKAD